MELLEYGIFREKIKNILEGYNDPVTCISISLNNKYIASGSLGMNIIIWKENIDSIYTD